jgi:hypothetical protein
VEGTWACFETQKLIADGRGLQCSKTCLPRIHMDERG